MNIPANEYVCTFYKFKRAYGIAEKAVKLLAEDSFRYQDDKEKKDFAFALAALYKEMQTPQKARYRIYSEIKAELKQKRLLHQQLQSTQSDNI